MRCLVCGHTESKVVNARFARDRTQIRRRRECLACQCRFTTYERLHLFPVMVIKKDGRREPFSREKLINGLKEATHKRPIPVETIEEIGDEILIQLADGKSREVSHRRIGEMVLERLLKVDRVSYVLFASVFKDFKTLLDFLTELEYLLNLKE